MTPRVPFAERGGTARGLLDLATGCYPAFLFGGSLAGTLPVFHFHEVTHAWLQPRLQYLAENGYRTVGCDGIARVALDGGEPEPHSVALTFDDAWSSVWTVAAPLLRSYGLTAILFAIPGRITDAASSRPTRDRDDDPIEGPPFVTWPELRALHESGVMDVQSHTKTHAMIFSHRQVIDYVTPDYERQPLLERPLSSSNGRASFIEPDALGTPLYLRRSRMSDARRFLADPDVASRCRRAVAERGGSAFFARPGWRQELDAITSNAAGIFESEDEQDAAIRTELAAGRSLLNEQLRATSVRHVALPWGIAGRMTRRALAETGHVTAFAERPLQRRTVRPGADRYGLTRLNGKFVTCLPGRRRQWFFTTV